MHASTRIFNQNHFLQRKVSRVNKPYRNQPQVSHSLIKVAW